MAKQAHPDTRLSPPFAAASLSGAIAGQDARLTPSVCLTSDRAPDTCVTSPPGPCRSPTVAFLRFPGRAGSSRNGAGKNHHASRRSSSGLNYTPGSFSLFGGSTSAARAVALWPLPFNKKKAAANSGRKRIMVLMSDTGGGHRASAEALKAGFQILYGDKYQVDYVDVWSNWTPYPFNELPKTYSFLVKNPSIWRMGYYAQQPRLVHYPTSAFTSLFVSHRIGKAFDKYQPDLVVSVHPLMQHVPLRVLRQRIKRGLQKPVEFATVVTDLTTCHNTWFHPNVDRCFVPTDFARKRALKMGLRPQQITVHGLPIRPAFSSAQQPKGVLRRKLGMNHSKPAVLLVGGGEGMGAIEKTVGAVVQKVGADCQLVVICGRNKKLVEKLKVRQYPEGMHVVVNGFVDNMAEWMSACDTIVTKAGPGTIAESLICGLPVLLNGFVPCQEAGNVPFVIENQVGAFEREPAKIADVLAAWLGPQKDEFTAMASRAKAIGKQWQNALFRIVEDLAAMVKEENVPGYAADIMSRRKFSWELGGT